MQRRLATTWRRRRSIVAGLALAAVAPDARADGPAERAIEYNRDIRPILAENCFACHGPDSAARKADLRLDRRDVAVEAGAIVPGNPDAERAGRADPLRRPDELMPPPDDQEDADRRAEGAAQALDRRGGRVPAALVVHRARSGPTPPTVKNEAWVRNPIDRFVLARAREATGLTPAPEADRRTLARRLSLDLTGLPPDAGRRRGVRQRHVARRLREATSTACSAPPHWGEHRGRYWLDAARYADTHGIHFDNYREIWAYRDWVINAFNRNMPFDQFTIEQLAGDLLPEPHARPAGRLRLQPLQHHDQRRRRDRRGIPRPLHPRPHRDRRRRSGWA